MKGEMMMIDMPVIFLNMRDTPFNMHLVLGEENIYVFKDSNEVVRRHAYKRIGAFITSQSSK